MMGTNLVTIRRVLFVFFLAWVPAVFYIAIRFASPVTAGLVALLAVAWSLPNYSAGVPSWYNLFFATFGAAALLCYLKLERRRWLFLAGACGGLSILVKIAGLYFVAAALIVLAYWEQSSSLGRGKTPVTGASDIPVRGEALSNHRAYTAFVAFAAVLLVLLLVALVQPLAGPIELIHFVLPGAAMATFLVWNEWTGRRPSSRQRFRALASLVAPFALGVAVPLAVLVLPYLASGTLADLADGLFTAPMRRMSSATWRLPRLSTTIAVLPLVFLLAASPRWSPARRLRVAGMLGVLLTLLLVVSQDRRIYQTIWSSMRALVPMTVVAGVWLLARRSPGHRRSAARRQPATGPRDESVPREEPDRNASLDGKKLMVLLAVAGICSLVQFPFSAPIYFLYVAPLAALAGLAVVSCQAPGPRPVFVALLVFYVAFAVRWINPGFIYWMGISYHPDTQTEVLDLERGGIRVSKEDKVTYETLVALVREHGGDGYVYATPDCPEVYFLSGLSNPTRTIFDFFDDPVGRTPRILSALSEKGVQVIVLNRKPEFSGPPGHDLLNALVAGFPQSTEVGRYVVRWKE